jgi:glyoxylase-like metal-dependent hydrolase (beta-lactamase superfamily II)
LAEFDPPVLTWSDDDADDREALFTSVRDARAELADPDTLVVVGHGRSAIAAASLAIHQRRLGIALDHVECIDADWSLPDPLSGEVMACPDRTDIVVRG